jgi:hypothetical protein
VRDVFLETTSLSQTSVRCGVPPARVCQILAMWIRHYRQLSLNLVDLL